MTFSRATWIAGGLAVVAAGVSTGAAGQEIRVTREVIAQGPIGASGPGGALQPIPQGTGLILGQTLDAGTNRPVPGSLVTLTLPNSRPIRSLADG